MHTDDSITKIKQHLHLGSIERNLRGGMKMKQTMKSVLLVSAFLTGCATSPNVGQILTETKTKKVEVVYCPTTMIKVCNGPDKETIAKYENVYCSCHSRRDVERALKHRMWEQINR
tara:strand:- start:666 stop:1013 length:348 start_codon:yes stop_codon:yes gene_type:complete